MELIKLSKEAREKEIEGAENWLKKLEEEANEHEITDYCDETENDDGKIEDSNVKELLESVQKAEKTRRISVERLKTAFNLTDMEKTIQNGGAHEDGTPKLALTKIGKEEAVCTINGEKLQMGRIKDITWSYVCSEETRSKRSDKIRLIISSSILFVGIAILVFGLTFRTEGGNFLVSNNALDIAAGIFMCIFLIGGGAWTISFATFYIGSHKSSFRCDTPTIPKTVLERLKGEGPFYTLFETKEGWKGVKPDPVIFRRIAVNGKDFWEPLSGWDMTQLEKESMTPLT